MKLYALLCCERWEDGWGVDKLIGIFSSDEKRDEAMKSILLEDEESFVLQDLELDKIWEQT